jgi:hypothetical protein
MQKLTVLLLCLASVVAGGCADHSEVSYEIPSNGAVPHTAGSSAGVNPDPGTNGSAVGTAVNPGH